MFVWLFTWLIYFIVVGLILLMILFEVAKYDFHVGLHSDAISYNY